LVMDSLTISHGAHLTIEPGVEVRFGPGAGLVVQGKLTANGTPTTPILFTTCLAQPMPSAWQGIRLMGSHNSIRHCQIDHAHYALRLTGASHHNMIADNVLCDNGDSKRPVGGSIVGTGNHNQFLRNQILDSPFGILLIQSSGNIVAGNELRYVGGVGIRLQGIGGARAAGNVVAGNRMAHVGGEGLSLAHQTDLTVADNRLYRAGEAATLSGIVPDLASLAHNSALPRAGALTLQDCHRATVTGNSIIESGWGRAPAYRAGVYIGASSRLALDSNRIQGNRGHGLEYAADNDGLAVIRNNAFWSNEGLGLISHCPSILDVSGNWWGTNTPQFGIDLSGGLRLFPWISMRLDVHTSPWTSIDSTQIEISVVLQDGAGRLAPDDLEVEIETELGLQSAVLATTSSGVAKVYCTIPLTTSSILVTARAGVTTESTMIYLHRPWDRTPSPSALARN
jgi:parallel beta-helix repeat protein